MTNNIINIQNEIEKILKKEFDKLISENKQNLLLNLLKNDELDKYSIDDLIKEINKTKKA